MAACSIDLILNAEVSGTTSTNIGSARVVTGSNTTISFRTMMGTSTEATASLEIKRFTGATLINTNLTASGVGLKDVSGSQIAFSDNPLLTGSWVPGKVGTYGLEFEYNAVADSRTTSLQGTYVDIGGTATDFAADQAFSIAGWVKPAYGGSEADRCMILANNSGDPVTTSQQNNGWYVLAYQKTLYFFFGESGLNFITKATDAAVFNTTDWIHFVVTYDGTELNSGMNIYIDGSSETSTGGSNGTFAGTTVDYTHAQLRLAGRNWGNSLFHRFPGIEDEIGIWNVELDSGAVSDLYNSGNGVEANTVSSSALVAYYDMEKRGPGSCELLDKSSGGNNGTLTNMDCGTSVFVEDWYDFYASGSAADISTLIKGIRIILQ